MTQIQVAYTDGDWRCYATDDARKRRYVGCAHRVPAAAIAHSDYIARHDSVPALSREAHTDPDSLSEVGSLRLSAVAGNDGTRSARSAP